MVKASECYTFRDYLCRPQWWITALPIILLTLLFEIGWRANNLCSRLIQWRDREDS